MNTTDKKMYMIPETETLSLGSMYSIMSMSDSGGGSGDPNDVDPNEFSTAPKRKVF